MGCVKLQEASRRRQNFEEKLSTMPNGLYGSNKIK